MTKYLKVIVANAQRILEGRLFKEECLKYTIGYFKDSSLTSLSREFYPRLGIAFILTQYYSLNPRMGCPEPINKLRST